jgi:predicted alpha/beta superfamily hydrolase
MTDLFLHSSLSPWEAPAVFGSEDFGGGAESTLHEILKLTQDTNKTYYIGGYSLAGLFALWAACRTDVFQGVAAASPSVWFPGFTDWLKTQKVQSNAVYLSLGDQEEHVKNRFIKRVGDCVRGEYELLKAQLGSENCTLVWNSGGHFQDGDKRLASAFSWCLKELEKI